MENKKQKPAEAFMTTVKDAFGGVKLFRVAIVVVVDLLLLYLKLQNYYLFYLKKNIVSNSTAKDN